MAPHPRCRPIAAHRRLFVGAFHGQRVGHHGAHAQKNAADGLAHNSISLIAQVSGGGCGDAADLLGKADPPPLGVLDRLHRFRQLRGHGDGVVLRIEDRRIAVGVGERLGNRTLREPSDLVEHRAHRVDVEIAVAA